jgi:predicted ribonuclease YlaK
MVCYPNVSVNDITEYIDSPKELQIAYEDLNNLKQKIEIAVNYSNQKNISALTEEECYKMANLLKPIQNMPGKWSIIAKMQTNIIEKLTEEQINVLELLDSNRIIGITGPAGSGKTITAIKWAQIH